MAADFPTNVVNLPNKSDGEKFYGAEYNKIVDEITAIETELKKSAADTIVQAADSAKLGGNDSAYFMPASYADGWVPAPGTWTYASATTITVPSGAAAIYKVGQGIKLTQTNVKYFYIVGVADTLLTITGGSNYTLTSAAISAVSYTNTPKTAIGFPSGFDYTPTWTAASANPAIGNGTITGRFSLDGKIATVSIAIVMGSTTTYGTGAWSVGLPFSAANTGVLRQSGIWSATDVGTTNYSGLCATTSTAALGFFVRDQGSNFLASNSPHVWANTDNLFINISFEIA